MNETALPRGVNYAVSNGKRTGKLVKKIQIRGKRYCCYGNTVDEVLGKVEQVKALHGIGSNVPITHDEWKTLRCRDRNVLRRLHFAYFGPPEKCKSCSY